MVQDSAINHTLIVCISVDHVCYILSAQEWNYVKAAWCVSKLANSIAERSITPCPTPVELWSRVAKQGPCASSAREHARARLAE